jgi:hypothetical protein
MHLNSRLWQLDSISLDSDGHFRGSGLLVSRIGYSTCDVGLRYSRWGPSLAVVCDKLHQLQDCLGVGARKDIASALNGFRPFRYVTDGYIGNIEEARFLLNGSVSEIGRMVPPNRMKSKNPNAQRSEGRHAEYQSRKPALGP